MPLSVTLSADEGVAVAAGTGADAQARRWEEQLLRERAVLAEQERRTASAEARARSWRAGADGERLVAEELDRLAAAGWRLLHDVHWPGRPRANLDHVAIGPGGVVVVDAKNWSHPATVQGGVLRCGSYRKTGDCEAVATMVSAVAALLEPRHRRLVRGVIALVQQDLAPVPAEAGAVVVGRRQLAECLGALPRVLTGQDVEVLAAHLAAALAAPTSPRQLTTAHLPAPGAPPRAAPRRSGGTPARTPARRSSARRPHPARPAHRLVRAVLAGGALWLLLTGATAVLGASGTAPDDAVPHPAVATSANP